MSDPNITKLPYDTYLAVIANSVGCNVWRNAYAEVSGTKTDIMRDGELSCAFFVSSILALLGFLSKPHMTVASTVIDLRESGWVEVAEPKPGAVVLWAPIRFDDGELHAHVGFYIGNERAVSNDYKKGTPQEHGWKNRDVEKIFWNPAFDTHA